MPTGGFAGLLPTTISTGNAGANSMYMTQVVAQQNGTATAVLIDIPSAASSLSFKAVVYDGSHGALLATGSTVTSLVAGYNRLPLTANLSLTAGTSYYAGYVCANSLSVTIGGAITPSWFVGGGQSVASPANPLVGGSLQGSGLMTALELDGTGSSGFGYSLDQSSAVTLSASNTVATMTTTVNQGARSLVTQVAGGSGKWYAEIVVSGSSFDSVGGIGVGAVAWSTNQSTPNTYLYALRPGGVVSGGAGPTIGLTWGAGDVVGLAYDPASKLLWWNKNNGSWFGASSSAGNPTSGTGGLAFGATLNWPVAVSVFSGTTGTAGAFTLHDNAASLQYAPPSGYSAWSSYVAPVLSSQARAMVLA